MKIAKVTDGNIEWIGEHSVYFGAPPTAEELTARGFVYCSYRSYDRLTQKPVGIDPVFENGEVFLDAIVPLTELEISIKKQEAMCKVRADRNRILTECDHTQLSDYPHADKAAWAAYRRALRDLPAATADARISVNWPLPPA